MSVIEKAGLEPFLTGQENSRHIADKFAGFVDQYRFFFFAGLLALYLMGFNGQWQLEPDSGLYLTLGQNLALGRGYTYHGVPHDLAYPGLPYALAAIFRLFPSHAKALFAADVMVLACGLAALVLTYRLIYLAYDRPTAVVITFGVGICHEFYRYCFEIMTDIPFVMGVMALLASHEALFVKRDPETREGGAPRRRGWDWALLVAGLAIIVTTRPTMIGLVGVWVFTLLAAVIRRRSAWRVLFGGLAVAALALVLFFAFNPRGTTPDQRIGGYEQNALRLLSNNLSVLFRTRVIDNLKDLFGQSAARAVFGTPLGPWWTNALLGGIALGGGIALIGKRALWGLWVLATILMIVFLVSHDRYLVEILPLLVLGWWRTIRFLSGLLPRQAGNWLFAGLVGFGSACNGGLVIAVIVHQHRHPFLADYKQGRFPPYVAIAETIHEQAGPTDIILAPTKLSRILTFLSDRTVIEKGSDNELNLTQHPLMVILDPADQDYSQWLIEQHIILVGDALGSVDRPTNAKAPPILLFRAKVK